MLRFVRLPACYFRECVISLRYCFRDRDDVLTLLIHLGYLVYDRDTKMARIPNEEIRLEFAKSIRRGKRYEYIIEPLTTAKPEPPS